MDTHEESVITMQLRFIVRDGQRILQQRHNVTRYYIDPKYPRSPPVVEDGWEWRDVPLVEVD